MRPGCDRPAAARLTYDPVACELWLDQLRGSGAPVQELCEFHVARLTVPRGWTVTDRRAPAVDGAQAVPPPVRADVEHVRAAEVEAAEPAPVDRPEPVGEAAAAATATTTGAEDRAGAAAGAATSSATDADDGAGADDGGRDDDGRDDDGRDDDAQVADEQVDGRAGAAGAAGGRPPLLERAFAWTGPQHSVLTTPHAESEEPAPQE